LLLSMMHHCQSWTVDLLRLNHAMWRSSRDRRDEQTHPTNRLRRPVLLHRPCSLIVAVLRRRSLHLESFRFFRRTTEKETDDFSARILRVQTHFQLISQPNANIFNAPHTPSLAILSFRRFRPPQRFVARDFSIQTTSLRH
jgi:hypothetical protein